MPVRAVRGAIPRERDEAVHRDEQLGEQLTGIPQRTTPRTRTAHVHPGAAAALREDLAP